MRTALVTGGSGYLGSHLGKALKKAGYYTVCFDINFTVIAKKSKPARNKKLRRLIRGFPKALKKLNTPIPYPKTVSPKLSKFERYFVRNHN